MLLLRWPRACLTQLPLALLLAAAAVVVSVSAQENRTSGKYEGYGINDEHGSAGSSFPNESQSNWCLEEWGSQVHDIDGIVVPNFCNDLGDKARLFDWCKQQYLRTPLQICMAEAPPFLHRRPLSDGNDTVRSNAAVCQQRQGWRESAGASSSMPVSELANRSISRRSFDDPAQYSLREFNGLFAGYDWELVMGIVEPQRLMNPETKVKLYPTQLSALYAMKQGECDIVAGGIPMVDVYRWPVFLCRDAEGTEAPSRGNICGLKYLDFPTYIGGYAALTKVEYARSLAVQFLESLGSSSIVNIGCAMAIAIFLSGNLIYLLEHKASDGSLLGGYAYGVEQGMWWSVATMTTVGYGDVVPYSVLGRTVGVIWMIIGLAVHGMFSAVLTSTLVSSEGALQYMSLNTFDDISARLQEDSTRRLCVVKDTYVATRVMSLSFAASVVLGDDLADCYGQLEDGTVIAVLADKAELFNEASQANPSATLPGCFENGVVLGKILESVPFSMTMRARYTSEDQSGVGGMEGFCRLASFHDFMSTSASRMLRDGGMYGSPYDTTGFLQGTSQQQRKWFGTHEGLYTEHIIGRDEGPAGHNVLLIGLTAAVYFSALLAFAFDRFKYQSVQPFIHVGDEDDMKSDDDSGRISVVFRRMVRAASYLSFTGARIGSPASRFYHDGISAKRDRRVCAQSPPVPEELEELEEPICSPGMLASNGSLGSLPGDVSARGVSFELERKSWKVCFKHDPASIPVPSLPTQGLDQKLGH